jgi:signal transduction histidine kinase
VSSLATGNGTRTGSLPVAALDGWHQGRLRSALSRHPVVADLLLTAVYLLVGLPHAAQNLRSGDLLTGAVLLTSAAAIAFRRRAPVAVLAVVTAGQLLDSVTSSSSGNPTGIWIALYTVAVTRAPRIALALAGLAGLLDFALALAGLAGVFGFSLRVTEVHGEALQRIDDGRLLPYGGLVAANVLLLTNILATGVGITVRQSCRRVAELRRWANEHAQLAAADERARIAREMHDIVAHSLSVLIALSDGATAVLPTNPQKAAEVLGELSLTGRSALTDMRHLLGVLRDPDQSEAPRAPVTDETALWPLLDRFRTAGLPVRYQQIGPPLPDNQPFQLAVYRILQEALTNALRYADRPTVVDARIVSDRSIVTISVTDDGRHRADGSASDGVGRGILGIQERAALYGGTVTAERRPEGGWAVKATLPIPERKT